MGSTQAFACFLWCTISFGLCDGLGNDTSEVDWVMDEQETSRSTRGHRLELIFPLLLRISSRLATLVPTVLLGVLGIFLFVGFSKKAFILSCIALYVTLKSKEKEGTREIIFLDSGRRDVCVAHVHSSRVPIAKGNAYNLFLLPNKQKNHLETSDWIIRIRPFSSDSLLKA